MIHNKELFEENLKRFAEFSKEEADLLKFKEPSRVFFSPNENGELNLKILDGKEESYLYSRKSVQEEAVNWFSAINTDQLKVLYVYGVGLGNYYLACKEWLKKDLTRFVFFLEHDPEIIQAFFQTDLAKEILHNRQVRLIYCSREVSTGDKVLDDLTTAFVFDPYQLEAIDYYKKKYPEAVQTLTTTFAHSIYSKQSRSWEFLSGGATFYNNYYNNLKHLPDSYFGNDLFGKFQNVPVIICGAGPSLEKNIHLLKTLTDRALIISGGSATNAINTYDLLPHFTVGIDPNPTQLVRILSNLAFTTPFFYRNRIYTESLTVHSGPKLYLTGAGGYNTPEWVEKKLGIFREDTLDEGYNVINFSVSIAKHLGCNPIILCGLDLAYTDNRSYISNMKFHALHNFKRTFITKGSHDELVGFKDIYGKSTTTLWKWINEASWFTFFQEANPQITLINATEGGIGFPQVKNMSLNDVANQYLKQSYDLETRVHGEIQNSHFKKDVTHTHILKLLKLLNSGLHKCEDYLKELVSKCQKLLKSRLENENFDIFPLLKDLSAIETKFHNEDFYKYVLKQFSDVYFWLFEKRMSYYLYDSLKEIKNPEIISRIQLELDDDKFLQYTLKINKVVLNRVINSYEKFTVTKNKKKKISPINSAIKKSDKNQTKNILYYPDRSVKIEESIENGVLNGLSVFYAKDGTILASSWYEKGLKTGKAYFYYETGELFALKNYVSGLLDGVQNYYYKDGSKKTVLQYKNGKLDGDVLLYFPSGHLKRELHFKDGKQEGVERMWNEQDVLLIEAYYKEDKPVQNAIWNYPNGNIRQKVMHHENIENYEIHCFTEDGKEIPESVVSEEDYFDKLIKMTNIFMLSIEDLFKKVDVVLPLLNHMEKSEIETSKEQFDLLRNELKKLIEMNQTINENFRGNAHTLNEPIWKSFSLQSKIEGQLKELVAVMKKEMKVVETLIETALNRKL